MPRRRSRDYDRVIDKRWNISKRGEYFHFICCDCALTHAVELRSREDGDVDWRMWRVDRVTRRNRKRFQITAAEIK
jgi:hypothetical protein